jgi:hypothetical protein
MQITHKNRLLVALLTTFALLLTTLPIAHTNAFEPSSLERPARASHVESSAPAKIWESPSLHQSGAKKTTTAAVTSTHQAANTVERNSFERVTDARTDSSQLPRLISPRAPPALPFTTL